MKSLPSGVDRWRGTYRGRVNKRYADGTSKRITVYGESVEVVLNRMAEVRLDQTPTAPVKQSLGSTLDQWWQEYLSIIKPLPDIAPVKPRVAWNTYVQRRDTYERHVGPAMVRGKSLANRPLSAITRDDCEVFFERLDIGGRARQVVYEMLRACFNLAVKKRRLLSTPLVGVAKPEHRSKETRIADEHQVLAIYREINALRRWVGLFTLAIHTALRQGELLGLRWTCVDLEHGLLRVEGNLTQTEMGLAVTRPKDKDARTVKLTADAVTVLRNERKRQMSQGIVSEYVFPSLKGGPVDRSTFRNKVFKPMLQRAGCPHLTFHGFRHLAATLLIESGADPKTVQDIMGHADWRTTAKVYAKVTPRMRADAAKKMQTRIDEIKHAAQGG